jgi:hypothetical protein
VHLWTVFVFFSYRLVDQILFLESWILFQVPGTYSVQAVINNLASEVIQVVIEDQLKPTIVNFKVAAKTISPSQAARITGSRRGFRRSWNYNINYNFVFMIQTTVQIIINDHTIYLKSNIDNIFFYQVFISVFDIYLAFPWFMMSQLALKLLIRKQFNFEHIFLTNERTKERRRAQNLFS